MLHQVIRRSYYLKKHLEAPLLDEREEYLEYLAGKGLYRETLKITAEYLLRIIEFLHLEEERPVSIEEIEKAGDAWAKSKHHHPMKKSFLNQGKEIYPAVDRLVKKDESTERPSG